MKRVQQKRRKPAKTNPFLFFSFVALLLLGVAKFTPNAYSHSCIDPSHMNCDGLCECDGYGCPSLSEIKLVKDTIK